jgi:hypothetical protein
MAASPLRGGWVDGEVGYLRLFGGLATKVDAADLPELVRVNWSIVTPQRGRPYVYRRLTRDRRTVSDYLHRILSGALPGQLADHINGDTLDNRRANLRACDALGNARNCAGKGGSSRFKGVSWYPAYGKWMAQITVNYRRRCLGYFATELEAAEAYNRAAATAFGAFARLNDLEAICA